MPSNVQLCEIATSFNSSRVSESVTYSTRCPKRTPSSKNCNAKVVLPLPGSPSTTYSRCGGKPPPRTLSRPGMPVVSRKLCVGEFADDGGVNLPPFALDSTLRGTKILADKKLSMPGERGCGTNSSRVSVERSSATWTYYTPTGHVDQAKR